MRLIDADDLIKTIYQEFYSNGTTIDDLFELIKNQPTIERNESLANKINIQILKDYETVVNKLQWENQCNGTRSDRERALKEELRLANKHIQQLEYIIKQYRALGYKVAEDETIQGVNNETI